MTHEPRPGVVDGWLEDAAAEEPKPLDDVAVGDLADTVDDLDVAPGTVEAAELVESNTSRMVADERKDPLELEPTTPADEE